MSLGEDFSSRIWKSSKKKQSSIVLSLDPVQVSDIPKYLYEIVSLLESGICAIKFNLHVIVPLGQDEMAKIVQMCHSYGLQVIADIKLNDIPSTNEIALKCLVEEGFDAIIANPIIGRLETIELVKKAHSLGTGILAVIYMSHPGATQTYGIHVCARSEKNGTRKVPMYRLLLKYAREAKVDGLIVGATRPNIIEEIASRKPAPIFSPGLGHQGGSILQASKYGVDYFIIGRSIIQSAEPLKTLGLIQDSLRKSQEPRS